MLLVYTQGTTRKREMQEIIHGVIVKSPQIGAVQFCLLTQEYGKIPVIALKPAQRTRMGLGNFVQSIVLHDHHNSFVAQSVELLAQPHLNFDNLGWFHHLLEISYFFCPMHQPAEEVYFALQTSLKLLLVQNTELHTIQLSLVGHMMSLFGFYPPPHFANALNIIKPLLMTTIDFHNPQNLKLLQQSAAMLQKQNIKQYHSWLLDCINTHPRISGFKTLPFVYKFI